MKIERGFSGTRRSQLAPDFSTMKPMKALPIMLIGLVALAMSVTAVADDSKCTPFGDPPAEVNHGYYASFVSSHNPICWGGKILGPWNDADGTPRYSCLYE